MKPHDVGSQTLSVSQVSGGWSKVKQKEELSHILHITILIYIQSIELFYMSMSTYKRIWEK